MTANELADEAMEHYKAEAPRGFNVNWMQEVAIMLRQQEKTIEFYYQMLRDKDVEIEALKQQLELAEWDEDAWKKFKRDNYEVINLGDIKDDCK
jgi:hypothetical protein